MTLPKRPAAHVMHSRAPVTSLYVPGLQLVHTRSLVAVDADCSYLPGEHAGESGAQLRSPFAVGALTSY